MNNPQQGHLTALTGLRGYAALWVVFYHFKGNAGVAGILDLGGWAYHGAWGVEIFFVLSGFVLSYVYAKEFRDGISAKLFTHYLALRLGRIYPLHVLLLIFFAALVYGGASFGITPSHPDNFRLEDLGWSLLLLHAWGVTDPLSWNYVSWSISAEWFAYLFLLPMYAIAGRRLSPKLLMSVATVSWCVFFVCGATNTDWEYRDQYEFAIWRIINDFFWGYALYRYWSERERPFPWVNSFFITSVCLIIGLAYAPGEWRILLIPAIACLLLSLTANVGVGHWLCSNRPALFLGEISYAIYMTHPAVQVMSNAIVRRLDLGGTQIVAAGILVIDVVLVIVVSTAAYYLIEHPCREWVRLKLK